jgi:hypothetical protein
MLYRSIIQKKPRKGMNKKGAIGLIWFAAILFLIIIVGFIAAMGIGVLDFVGDEITPIMSELGMAGDTTNMSEIAGYTFVPLNNVIQSLKWLGGLAFMMALIFSIVFGMSYSYNPHPVFIGFYFALILLLIFGTIFMSNMYEDIYTGTDDIALRLQEQTILSYMILYSPFIIALISFITGIFIFTRSGNEVGV